MVVTRWANRKIWRVRKDPPCTRRAYRFFDDLRPPLRDPFFFGTFAPASRASERPIAIACLRLLTRLPDRPLFSVPRLRSCIARSTFSPAFFPYLAMHTLHTGGPHMLVLCRLTYDPSRMIRPASMSQ